MLGYASGNKRQKKEMKLTCYLHLYFSRTYSLFIYCLLLFYSASLTTTTSISLDQTEIKRNIHNPSKINMHIRKSNKLNIPLYPQFVCNGNENFNMCKHCRMQVRKQSKYNFCCLYSIKYRFSFSRDNWKFVIRLRIFVAFTGWSLIFLFPFKSTCTMIENAWKFSINLVLQRKTLY